MTTNHKVKPIDTLAPHDADIEQALLGMILLSPADTAAILETIQPDAFFILRNAWIFEAMQSLHSQGLTIDNLTVADALEKKGRLADVGGRAYLTLLIANTVSVKQAPAYALYLQRLAGRRNLLSTASQIATLATSDQLDYPQIQAKVSEIVEQSLLTENTLPADLFVKRSASLSALEDWLHEKDNQHNIVTIKNPLHCIHSLGGFAEYLTGGKVMVLAAPSGGGKTTTLDMMIGNLIADGLHVLLWGGEWTPAENARRTLQQLQGPTMDALFAEEMARQGKGTGQLTDKTKGDASKQLLAMVNKMTTGKYGDVHEYNARYASHDLKQTLHNMRVYLRQQARAGQPIHVVVFDYIQLVNLPADVQTNNMAEYAFDMFKQFCMAEGVIGIMTSQVNKSKQNGRDIGAGDLQYLRPDMTNCMVILERVFNKADVELPYTRFNVVKNSIGQSGKVYVNGTMTNLRLDISAKNVANRAEVERRMAEGGNNGFSL